MTPEFDADVLALQGWINRAGLIPLSEQWRLREAVGRVLDKYEKLREELAEAREALMASRNEAFRLYNDLANQKEGE